MILSSSCGRAEPDFIASGVYVYTNGYDIDPLKLKESFLMTEKGMRVLYSDFRFDQFALEYQISLTYETIIDPPGRRGYTIDNNTWVEPDNCIDIYYVAAHEVMHTIARYYLNIPFEESRDHNIKNFFFAYHYREETLDNFIVERFTILILSI